MLPLHSAESIPPVSRLQPALEGGNEKLKVNVKDLRAEMGIQGHLNEALKEEIPPLLPTRKRWKSRYADSRPM